MWEESCIFSAVNVSLWCLLLSRLPKFMFQTELAFLTRYFPKPSGQREDTKQQASGAPPLCMCVSGFLRVLFCVCQHLHKEEKEDSQVSELLIMSQDDFREIKFII